MSSNASATKYIASNAALTVAASCFDVLLATYLVGTLHWRAAHALMSVGIVHFLIAALELPTGAYGDIYGRSTSVQLGFLAMSASFISITLASLDAHMATWAVLLFLILFSLGWTLISGSLDAWICDSIPSEHYTKTFSRSSFYCQLAGFITVSVVPNLQAGLQPYIWGICAVLTLLVSGLFTQSERRKRRPTRDGTNPSITIFSVIIDGVTAILKSRALTTILFIQSATYWSYAVLIQGVTVHFNFLRQFTGEQNSNYLWTAMAISGFFGSFLQSRVSTGSAFSGRPLTFSLMFSSVALVALYSGISLFAGATGTLLIFAMVCLGVKFLRSFSGPVLLSLLNREISNPSLRATILSFSSLVNEGGAGLLSLSLGTVFLRSDSMVPFWWASSTLCTGIIALMLITSRVSKSRLERS